MNKEKYTKDYKAVARCAGYYMVMLCLSNDLDLTSPCRLLNSRITNNDSVVEFHDIPRWGLLKEMSK